MPDRDYLNTIICEDCCKAIPTLPDDYIDMVITAPPYQKDLEDHGPYHEAKDHKKYITWLRNIFKKLHPKLKKGGRIAVVIGDGANGRIPTHSDIIQFMTSGTTPYLHMSTIIWNKEKSSSRTAWGSYASPVEPSLPTSFEYILVFAKDTYRIQRDGETDMTKQEFVDWSLALWTLPRQEYRLCSKIIKNGVHPSPFPAEIARRLIKMFTWSGAVVLDPFNGMGTTSIECKKAERNYIGIDSSKKHCETAENLLSRIVVPYSLVFEEAEE